MGWLSAKVKDQPHTRAEMYGEKLPELPPSETLADHWQNMGLARLLPMGGYAGFEWQEVAAFKSAVQADLSPVEAQTLIDMSRAYASGLADTNPLSIEPMERIYD